MSKTLWCTCLVVLFSVCNAFAMQPSNGAGCGSQECAKCHTLTVKEAAELLKPVGINVKSVKPAPSHGLHEVFFEKQGKVGIVFIDYGKKHAIQGVIVDLKNFEPVAAHEKEFPKPKEFSGVAPASIPVKHAFVIGNPKGSKKLYVFTDPDCPYCRQIHPLLQQLEKKMPDLSINIMLYPLRQLHPAAYDKSRVVIASQKRELLDKAFEGKELPKPKGDEGKAAIDAIIAFAEANEINGTPLILLPDGSLYSGNRTVEAIKQAIEKK